MKSQLKFALLLAIGAGIPGAGAAAQQPRVNIAAEAQARFATFNSGQVVSLQQVDRRRRCDGDGDRDDRGCYYVYTTPSRGYGYYGNGYYATPMPYYVPNRGWYDSHGRWHAYDRDRDRDRRRHHDDDRR